MAEAEGKLARTRDGMRCVPFLSIARRERELHGSGISGKVVFLRFYSCRQKLQSDSSNFTLFARVSRSGRTQRLYAGYIDSTPVSVAKNIPLQAISSWYAHPSRRLA